MLGFLGFIWDCVNISLHHCILASLYPCVIMLLHHCILVSLCYYVIVSLHHCVIVLLCYCVIVLLCYCVIVWMKNGKGYRTRKNGFLYRSCPSFSASMQWRGVAVSQWSGVARWTWLVLDIEHHSEGGSIVHVEEWENCASSECVCGI